MAAPWRVAEGAQLEPWRHICMRRAAHRACCLQGAARSLKKYACPICTALKGQPNDLDAAIGRTKRTRSASLGDVAVTRIARLTSYQWWLSDGSATCEATMPGVVPEVSCSAISRPPEASRMPLKEGTQGDAVVCSPHRRVRRAGGWSGGSAVICSPHCRATCEQADMCMCM